MEKYGAQGEAGDEREPLSWVTNFNGELPISEIKVSNASRQYLQKSQLKNCSEQDTDRDTGHVEPYWSLRQKEKSVVLTATLCKMFAFCSS